MKKILDKKWVSYTLAACSAVTLYMILAHVSPILNWISSLWKMLNPVVIGFVIAYLINPVMVFLENKPFKKLKNENIRHILGVVCSVIFALLIVSAVIIMVVPALISSITGLVTNFNKYGYSNVTALLEEFNKFDLGFKIDTSDFDKYIDQGLNTLFTTIKNNLSSILNQVNSIGSSVVNIVIGFIIAIYLLVGKKSVTGAVQKFRKTAMTTSQYKTESEFWKRCHEIFIQYIGCSLLDGLIIGTVTFLFMMITGMENATLIAVIIAFTNLLPTFGPIIGGLLGAIFLVLTNPTHALMFIVFMVILQAIDGYVIKPKLFSSSLGLSPVLSLISIILGSKMFGFIGILLAIPVTAVLVMLYTEKLLPWIEKKKNEKEQNISSETSDEKQPEEAK